MAINSSFSDSETSGNGYLLHDIDEQLYLSCSSEVDKATQLCLIQIGA